MHTHTYIHAHTCTNICTDTRTHTHAHTKSERQSERGREREREGGREGGRERERERGRERSKERELGGVAVVPDYIQLSLGARQGFGFRVSTTSLGTLEEHATISGHLNPGCLPAQGKLALYIKPPKTSQFRVSGAWDLQSPLRTCQNPRLLATDREPQVHRHPQSTARTCG